MFDNLLTTFVLLLAGAGVIALSAVALSGASDAKRQLKILQKKFDLLSMEFSRLKARLQRERVEPLDSSEAPITEPPIAEPPITEPPITDTPIATPPIATPPITDAPTTTPPIADAPTTTPPIADAPITAPPITDAPITDTPITDAPITTPPITDAPMAPQPMAQVKPQSIEEKIGLTWFTRIGMLLVACGIGFFFKYMVDNNLIGPWGRVAVGVVVGIIFLAIGELLARKKKAHEIFVQGMVGLGLVVLLLSSYASYAFYQLIPHLVAFLIIAMLAIFGALLAIHHKAQSILLVSIIAAFVNPILLSTGSDRPFALFTYLTIMTSGALFVSIRHGYHLATWTAVGGVVCLFGGWYVRSFDASAAPASGLVDRPASELQGAYYPLSQRWAPLLYAALFPLQWVIAGLQLRRKDDQASAGQMSTAQVSSTAMYSIAAVAAHGAFTALLYDHALILGAVTVGLSLAFGLLFTWQRKTHLMGLALLSSFAVLAGLRLNVEGAQVFAPLVLAGISALIYFSFLFYRAKKDNTFGQPIVLWTIGGCGTGVLFVGALCLLPNHFELLMALVAGLSVIYLALGSTQRSTEISVAAFFHSLVGIVAGIFIVHGQRFARNATAETYYLFIALTALWALIYLFFTAYDLLRLKAQAELGRIVVLCSVAVGFVVIVFLASAEAATILRASSLGALGVVYFILGGKMLKAEDGLAKLSSLPLGIALTLFTVAIAQLLAGPMLTLVWAAEAVMLAYLGWQMKQKSWFAFAAALLGATAVHMLTVDFLWVREQAMLFHSTLGGKGTLTPTPFLHNRAYGLLILTAAFLAAGFWATKASKTETAEPKAEPEADQGASPHANDDTQLLRYGALTCLALGHLTLLLLVVFEGRLLFTDYADVTLATLPADEFTAQIKKFRDVLQSQTARLDVVETVILGIYASALLVIGFVARNRFHRFFGLGLFGLTVTKLGLWDVWKLERIYQIIVLVVIGLMLLGGGFLYARFSSRLKALLLEDTKLSSLLLLVGAALLAPSTAHAFSPGDHPTKATISGIQRPGDYRLVISQELYATSKAHHLSDLRITANNGEEIPYTIRSLHRLYPAKFTAAQLLNPVKLANGGSSAILDLGKQEIRHSKIILQIQGNDYLRQTTVESSQDGKTFALLASGAYLFDISTKGPRANRNWLAYPQTNSRYLRITLLPGADKQSLTIIGATVKVVHATPTQSLEGKIALLSATEEDRKAKRSLIKLRELPTGVAIESVELTVSNGAFIRRIEAESSTRRLAWMHAGAGFIYRLERPEAHRHGEGLRLAVDPAKRPFLRLWIENNDDKPLSVTAAHGIYKKEEIIFRTPHTGPHTLHIGNAKSRAPRYDLAALIQRGGTATLHQAQIGPLRINARQPAAAPKSPKALPLSERYAWLIKLVIGGILLLLGVWSIMLLRKNGSRDS